MARKPRIELARAIYHVISGGGDRREVIYQDDEDRERFLSYIGEDRCIAGNARSKFDKILPSEN